jgi:hypothetical protein
MPLKIKPKDKFNQLKLCCPLCFKTVIPHFSDEQTPAEDIFKLTPEEIADDPENKKIHDALETVGKKNKTITGKIGLLFLL